MSATQHVVNCLQGGSRPPVARPALLRQGHTQRTIRQPGFCKSARCMQLRAAAEVTEADAATTVDAPAEAVPAPSADAEPAARSGGGDRGGGRGRGGWGGQRSEPTVRTEDLAPDQEYDGVVKSVQTYGAFVDFGGPSHGLVHISQLSATGDFVRNVSEAVRPGQQVHVRVLSVDGPNKVSLTMRPKGVEAAKAGGARAEGERSDSRRDDGEGGFRGGGGGRAGPGGRLRREGKIAGGRGGQRSRPQPTVKPGETVKAKVQRTTPYGAFLDLPDGTNALLHISEMANPDNLDEPQPRQLVDDGDELEVRVLSVKGGKVDVTQKSQEEADADRDALKGVSSEMPTAANSLFEFALAKAGVRSQSFETDDERRTREAAAAEPKQEEAAPAAAEAAADEAPAAEAEAAAETLAAEAEDTAEASAAEAEPAAETPHAEVEPAAETPDAEASALDTVVAPPSATPAEQPEPSAPAEGATGTQPEAYAPNSPSQDSNLLQQAEDAVKSAAETVSEAVEQPLQQTESAAVSAAEAVADKAPEPVSTIAHAAADTINDEPKAADSGNASASQLEAGGESGVAADGVKESEVAAEPAADEDPKQETPAAAAQPAASSNGGAAALQLDAAGEGGVADDGVKESEVAAVEPAAAAPAPDAGTAPAQKDAAGESGVKDDGVKPAEASAPAAGAISAKVVKQLREKSGAGMMACKGALKDAGGDFDKALEALKVKGLAQAAKKAGRIASEGIVAQYIHAGSRLGVLLEMNCETDFVARGGQFKELVADIAMQVAASPEAMYITTEDVAQEFVDLETAAEMQKEDIQAKPEQIRPKIVEGRVAKTIARGALLEQVFIRDTSKTVGDVVKDAIATLGENIRIRRFERFVLGEGIEKKQSDLAAEVEEQTKSMEKAAAEKAAAVKPAAEDATEPAAEAKPAVQVSAKAVKALREKSGAGMMDCKKALADAGGDEDAAAELLRAKGLAQAGKKASRTASDGAIGAYIHPGSRLGVLVELNCETDFVARGDKFKELLADLAMQVAACPSVAVVAVEDVDQAMLEQERAIELQKEDLQSKPEQIREKVVEGRLAKLAKEQALMEQPFIKDTSKTVSDIVTAAIATIGENIQVRRFARYNLGEGLEKKSNDFAAEVAAQTGGKA